MVDLFFKTGKEKQKRGKEKQSRGKEKQSRGKEKQPLNLFFPCLKKKGRRKIKAEGRTGKNDKDSCQLFMEPRSIIEQKKENIILFDFFTLFGQFLT